MATLLDELSLRVRAFTSACAASQDLTQIKDMLEKGSQAAKVAAVMDPAGRAADALTKGAERLDQVHGLLGGLQDVCVDAQAILRIRDALRVLNNPENVKPGSREAAKAFGDLFVGAGRFVGKLPPPVNAYAQLLEASGSFFVDIQRELDPMTNTHSKGRAMREVWSGFERGEY